MTGPPDTALGGPSTAALPCSTSATVPEHVARFAVPGGGFIESPKPRLPPQASLVRCFRLASIHHSYEETY